LAGETLPADPPQYDTLTLNVDVEPLRFRLRRDLAPASIDTIVEVFYRGVHTKLPGFRGEAGGTVVDIGANEGFYSRRLQLNNPALSIIAAEPLAENRELFAANVAGRLHAVGRLHTARSDTHPGESRLYPAAITDRDGDVMLETYPHVGSIAALEMMQFPRPWIRPDRIRRRRVPALRLRSLLDDAGIHEAELCKMDIEGAELAVIAGDPSVFRRFRRVVVECHGPEARRVCAQRLQGQGFILRFAEPKRSGDLYFERADLQDPSMGAGGGGGS
jgi:FkbM family methyltransferase